MDHVHDEPSHEAVVDAWLARSADHGSSVEIVQLFHAALDAVSRSTRATSTCSAGRARPSAPASSSPSWLDRLTTRKAVRVVIDAVTQLTGEQLGLDQPRRVLCQLATRFKDSG